MGVCFYGFGQVKSGYNYFKGKILVRILAIAARWLFMLLLPLLLLSASIGWLANSEWLYQYSFNKYNVGQTTGLSDAELGKVAAELTDYFNSDAEYISLTVTKDGELFELFNQREIIHLKDVKGLIRLDYLILLNTLIYILGYAGITLLWRGKSLRQQLAQGLIGGSIITLALMLGLGIGTLFNFDNLFWQFHLISFSNNYWLLNPARDYMIMLFTRGFFYDVTVICATITTALALGLGAVGWGYLKSQYKLPETEP